MKLVSQPSTVTGRAACSQPAAAETFALAGRPATPLQRWFTDGLVAEILRRGHRQLDEPGDDIRMVLNVVDADSPQTYRRKAQATFVVAIAELPAPPENPIRTGYPLLVRALANLMIMISRTDDGVSVHFITPEQGHYAIQSRTGSDGEFFRQVYGRIEPIVSSQLVIQNVFNTDLEEELWNGDEITGQISRAGKRLEAMDLLPAPFPIDQLLDPRELRHVKRLYGLGGLSYGNLSARKDGNRFWMSASGVNKAKLEVVGQDILMVSGYDPEETAMILSVPPTVQPRRVSVDAIEHWIIYQQHPDIQAIVHIHAWMDGIRSTEFNYPCGTIQLAQAVADLLQEEPDPANAVIGLKNHGVTITGPTMDAIFERIEDRIQRQVPMS